MMMYKFFILCIVAVCSSSVMASESFIVNKKSKEIVNSIVQSQIGNNSEAFKDFEKAKALIGDKKQESGYEIYVLISETVPTNYLKNLILEAYVLNSYNATKTVFVLQGVCSKEFTERWSKIYNSFNKYNEVSAIKSNINLLFDPSLFDKFKIKAVPVLMLSSYQNGESYPDDTKVKYILTGKNTLVYFLSKISKKDKNFANMSKILTDNF